MRSLAARFPGLFCWISLAVTAGPRLSPESDYHRFIDPLVSVTDFGVEYYDDGAAVASILRPTGLDRPDGPLGEPVVALLRLGPKSIPLLIDCLDDERVTSAAFQGTSIVRPMKVPVGFLCLDVLIGFTWGKAVSERECADDGLGACVKEGFYFRPDEYTSCSDSICVARTWVFVVQRKWRSAYLRGKLRFRNPYDQTDADEYKQYSTAGLRKGSSRK